MTHRRGRAVVVVVNGLGDHLMMLPVVRALSHVFDGRLVIAALPVAPVVFAGVPIERFVTLRLTPGRGARAVDVEAAAADIGWADTVVSLNRTDDEDVRTFARLVATGPTAGLFPHFALHVPFDQRAHCTDLAFRLVQRFDDRLEIDAFAGPPDAGAHGNRRGREFAALLPPGLDLLLVHADTSADKEWTVEAFQRTLDDFLVAHPNFVALVLGTRDVGIRPGPTRRIFPAIGLPLDVSLALMGRGTAFLGVDSAMLHAADLFRVPTVALFGPGDPRQFGCRFCRHEHIVAPSMAAISVAAVRQALERLVAPDAQ
jgi:ADP-heptose:LPS heptosyltransferase